MKWIYQFQILVNCSDKYQRKVVQIQFVKHKLSQWIYVEYDDGDLYPQKKNT